MTGPLFVVHRPGMGCCVLRCMWSGHFRSRQVLTNCTCFNIKRRKKGRSEAGFYWFQCQYFQFIEMDNMVLSVFPFYSIEQTHQTQPKNPIISSDLTLNVMEFSLEQMVAFLWVCWLFKVMDRRQNNWTDAVICQKSPQVFHSINPLKIYPWISSNCKVWQSTPSLDFLNLIVLQMQLLWLFWFNQIWLLNL